MRRYEAHLWIKELHRQVYLGGYEHEEHAAEAYDVAALKSKGMHVKTNFDIARHGFCSHQVEIDNLPQLPAAYLPCSLTKKLLQSAVPTLRAFARLIIVSNASR